MPDAQTDLLRRDDDRRFRRRTRRREPVAADPVEKVRELKQQPGKGIWLVGGGELAGVLYSEIDELVIKLNPLTIGSGIPVFGRNAAFDVARFTLTDHKVLDGGVFLTYARV